MFTEIALEEFAAKIWVLLLTYCNIALAILSVPSVGLLMDVAKPSWGLIHYIQRRRKMLPDIRVSCPKSLMTKHYFGSIWKSYDVNVSIVNKILTSTASNCQGQIIVKPKNGEEKVMKPLAWCVPFNPGSYTLEKGNPQNLRLFMFDGINGKKRFGVCISDISATDGFVPSPLHEGHFDYLRLEIYCSEWKGYKAYKTWKNIKVPEYFESMPLG